MRFESQTDAALGTFKLDNLRHLPWQKNELPWQERPALRAPALLRLLVEIAQEPVLLADDHLQETTSPGTGSQFVQSI